jgi:hypothetical protein
MTGSIAISISVNPSSGMLRTEFVNLGLQQAVLRHLFEPQDLVIENENGNRAEYYLSFPYGARLDTFVLEPGDSYVCEVNLATDFIYPDTGKYRAWVEYDTETPTAKYETAKLTAVRVVSNVVQFPIKLPSTK